MKRELRHDTRSDESGKPDTNDEVPGFRAVKRNASSMPADPLCCRDNITYSITFDASLKADGPSSANASSAVCSPRLSSSAWKFDAESSSAQRRKGRQRGGTVRHTVHRMAAVLVAANAISMRCIYWNFARREATIVHAPLSARVAQRWHRTV